MVGARAGPVPLASLHFHAVEIPLRIQFAHARARRSSTRNIVVSARLANGTEGVGEGVPREYVTGETPETAREALLSGDFAPLARPAGSFAEVVEARRSFGGSGARRPQPMTRGRTSSIASGQSVSTDPLTARPVERTPTDPRSRGPGPGRPERATRPATHVLLLILRACSLEAHSGSGRSQPDGRDRRRTISRSCPSVQ